MRIEDMKSWTVDQLKNEVVRLSEECEKKQHELLDLQEHQIELERNFDEMVMYGESELINDTQPDKNETDFTESLKMYEDHHQSDCITINQLQTALDVIVDRYANLRKIHGVELTWSKKQKKLARTEGEPVKEIADFAKTHPYEYMRKCLDQYPYWGNKDNGFNRQKI